MKITLIIFLSLFIGNSTSYAMKPHKDSSQKDSKKPSKEAPTSSEEKVPNLLEQLMGSIMNPSGSSSSLENDFFKLLSLGDEIFKEMGIPGDQSLGKKLFAATKTEPNSEETMGKTLNSVKKSLEKSYEEDFSPQKPFPQPPEKTVSQSLKEMLKSLTFDLPDLGMRFGLATGIDYPLNINIDNSGKCFKQYLDSASTFFRNNYQPEVSQTLEQAGQQWLTSLSQEKDFIIHGITEGSDTLCEGLFSPEGNEIMPVPPLLPQKKFPEGLPQKIINFGNQILELSTQAKNHYEQFRKNFLQALSPSRKEINDHNWSQLDELVDTFTMCLRMTTQESIVRFLKASTESASSWWKKGQQASQEEKEQWKPQVKKDMDDQVYSFIIKS